MKRVLLMAATIAFLFGCQKINNAISDLDKRVSQLEGTRISTIEQQIESMKISISELKEVSNTLKEQIAALENQEIPTTEDLANLKAKDIEIEQAIATLREYVDSLNQGTIDWISATFATLEQYKSLSATLAGLQSQLDNIKSENLTQISNAISALEESMKSWINEQLSGYYTIAQIDSKIAELESQIENCTDESLANELIEIKGNLQSLQTELTEAYKKAISEAITENNGVIDAKIAAAVAEINNKIESEIAKINVKITSIELRLNELEEKINEINNRKLDIVFEVENEGVVIAGGSCKVTYTVTSSCEEIHIATIAQEGWHASVTELSEKEGYITVTAPERWTDSPIIVLVSDANTTIMRTLTFESSVVIIENDNIEITNDASTLDIRVKLNTKRYKVVIPATANWITLQEEPTRAAMYDEVIRLNIEKNRTTESRSATIQLLCDDVVAGSFTIHQEGITIANNMIIYTSANGQIINPYTSDKLLTFGANIVSNSYEDGVGIITFDRDLTRVGFNAFRFCAFTSVTLPNSVETIGSWSFHSCHSLTKVVIPDGVTTIDEEAFSNCDEVTEVVIGKSVESIGMNAFGGSAKLSNIIWSESLTTIGERAFCDCISLESVKIPGSVTTIGKWAFSSCKGLTTATIGTGVTELGWYAFWACSLLKDVYCLPSTPPAGGYAAFSLIAPDAVIHVPYGSYDAYITAEYWSEFSSIMRRTE